uniref:Uncharacterized protein n=1 Tax=Aureoumbra lagunensis TaxID=44058 RepID=A0A7S3NGS8_9STRA|mmetsp:Transcript_9686/g.13450  ORF Transcript_9686/g.13450 Transcript_9686/m.13450 type:complete len:145 (+) Transcript_9686:31-465(+)
MMNVVRQTLSRALLECGSSLDRLGMTLAADYSFYDHLSQHRPIVGLMEEGIPSVASSAKVASTATLIGGIEVAADAIIGHGAIINGPKTFIGEASSIGIGAVLKKGVVLEPNATVAPGALVPENTTVPSGELWAGTPATFVKKL